MSTLSTQNIESELSYAYLHAIAASAGMSCKPGDRHDDGFGIDAEVNYRGATGHAYITHVQLNIQLKATVKDRGNYPNHHTYYMGGVDRYDKLRTNDGVIPKILVVLFLPDNPATWLTCSPSDLIMKDAAYWVSLQGAPASTNKTGETIYLPKANLLTAPGLIQLAKDAANKTIPNYVKP